MFGVTIVTIKHYRVCEMCVLWKQHGRRFQETADLDMCSRFKMPGPPYLEFNIMSFVQVH